MSGESDKWKNGLPKKALVKINQLESQLERLKEEKYQKQFQLERLEETLQVQRREGIKEKSKLKRENKTLSETSQELERKGLKLANDLLVKEKQVTSLEQKVLKLSGHQDAGKGEDILTISSNSFSEQIKILEDEIKSLRQQLGDKQTEQISVNAPNLKSSGAEVPKHISHVDELSKTQQELRSLQASALDQVKDSSRALAEVKSKCQQEFNAAQAEQNKLKGLLEKAEMANAALEGEKKLMNKKLASAEDLLKTHDRRMAEVKKKKAVVDAKLKKINFEKYRKTGTGRLQAQQKLGRNDLSERYISNLEKKVQHLNQDLKYYEEKLQSRKSKLVEYGQHMELLNKQIRELEENFMEKGKTQSVISSEKLESLKVELLEVKEEKDYYRDKLFAFAQRAEKHLETVKRLKQENNYMSSKLKIMKSQKTSFNIKSNNFNNLQLQVIQGQTAELDAANSMPTNSVILKETEVKSSVSVMENKNGMENFMSATMSVNIEDSEQVIPVIHSISEKNHLNSPSQILSKRPPEQSQNSVGSKKFKVSFQEAMPDITAIKDEAATHTANK